MNTPKPTHKPASTQCAGKQTAIGMMLEKGDFKKIIHKYLKLQKRGKYEFSN